MLNFLKRLWRSSEDAVSPPPAGGEASVPSSGEAAVQPVDHVPGTETSNRGEAPAVLETVPPASVEASLANAMTESVLPEPEGPPETEAAESVEVSAPEVPVSEASDACPADHKTDDTPADPEGPSEEAAPSEPAAEPMAAPTPSPPPKKLLVVLSAREEMNRQVLEELQPLGFHLTLWPFKREDTRPFEQRLGEAGPFDGAVVLLTGEDFVYAKTSKPAEARLRPPSRTVFELGFLLGRLGRARLIILYHEQKSFSLPTDLCEAVYTPFDRHGQWRKDLRQRLILAELISSGGKEGI